ncbi:hypothetical protein BH11PAT4_BH11PAT4_4670 [soil metagenome]
MSQPSNHKEPLSAATISAVIGGALIVAAVIALVSSNWGTFSSLAKVAILALPVIGLYAAGFLTRSQDHFKEVSTVSLFTANFAFPFVLGVAIFEMSGAPAIDGNFIALVSGISFLWFAVVEFFLKVREISFLTYTALASWIVAMGSTVPNMPFFNDLAFIAIGIVTLLGIHLAVPGKEGVRQLRTYLILGALSFFTTVFTLGSSVRDGLSMMDDGGAITTLGSDLLVMLSYILLGALGIVIAITMAERWKETSERLYGELRLVSEQSILLLAAIPTFIVAVSSGYDDTIAQVLIALLTAGASLLFATRLKLKSTVTVSWVLCAFLVGHLLIEAFAAAEISWPVLVLVIGSLLFVLAFFLSARQRKIAGTAHPVVAHTPLWGLGEPLPIINGDADAAVNEVTRPDGSTVTFVHENKRQAEHYLSGFIFQGILFLLIVRVILPNVLGVF